MRTTPVALLCAVLIGPSSGAAAATPTVLVADCLREREAPTGIVLACADGNARLTALAWTGWGTPAATATGNLARNTCDPSCVEGTFTSTPVTVRADRRQRCTGASHRDRRLTVSFVDPAGGDGIVVPYRCPVVVPVGSVRSGPVTFRFTALKRGPRANAPGALRVDAVRAGRRVATTRAAGLRWLPLTSGPGVVTIRAAGPRVATVTIEGLPAGGRTIVRTELRGRVIVVSAAAVQ